ncbi:MULTISPECIES: LysE family translocator [Rhodobacterales]|uniref:LysE family translocator n=1 Tax=Roseobacter sp. N2S TaxID=2663844 RepID=UPI0028596691|nr:MULTISPECIES: LysE family translocator [Rhodobacterales]MDR6267231.1 threonine/homoserine/homoserine lactone efflux protein [Roseobacter sp. N2S]
MLTPEFILLWFGWLLAGGSPGPATLSVAGTAMQRGRSAALMVALGILAGSASLGLAAALGLGAIMLGNAWVFEIIRYFGAAYLLFLAIKALRSSLRPADEIVGTPFTGGPRRLFAKGMALHLTNPKAILSWGSIYAIVAPHDASLGELFTYFGVLFMASILVFISYAFLFSTPGIVRGYKKAQRGFNLAFAGFFGFASIKILTARIT